MSVKGTKVRHQGLQDAKSEPNGGNRIVAEPVKTFCFIQVDTNKTTVRFFVVGSELQFKKKARPFLDTSKHGRREGQSLPQSGLLESDTRVDTSYDRQNADQSFLKG